MPQRPTQGVRLLLGTDAITPVFSDIAYITSFTGPDGTKNELDATHLLSTSKEYLVGLPDWGTYQFDIWFDPAQASHDDLRDLFQSGDERTWRIVYVPAIADNADEFVASVRNFSRSGGVDAVLAGSVTLRITGDVDVVTDTTP